MFQCSNQDVALRGVRLINYSSQTRSATPLFNSFFEFPHDRQYMDKV